MAVRIYQKLTCPICGKKIGANNFARHKRSCKANTENKIEQQNIIDDLVKDLSEIEQQCICDIPVESVDENELIEILAFDTSVVIFNLDGDTLILHMFHNSESYSIPFVSVENGFISFEKGLYYIPMEFLKKNLPGIDFSKYDYYKDMFDDYKARFMITRKRWKNRFTTRKCL